LLGTHFFNNPPRSLKLLELIPTANTDSMRIFAEYVLGQGVVIARDTPDVIANRPGTFAGMQAITYAFDGGYAIEELDALTGPLIGPLIGRPSTATFRLHDWTMSAPAWTNSTRCSWVFGLRRSPWWPRHTARRWAAGWSLVCMPTRSWG